MTAHTASKLPDLLRQHETEILDDWMRAQLGAATMRADLISPKELEDQSRNFLRKLSEAIQRGEMSDITGTSWAEMRDLLEDLAGTRSRQGFTPAETATFFFSLKQPLFERMQRNAGSDMVLLAREAWAATLLLDKLGLHTIELHQKARERLISRQQQDMLELSTPVVQLWDNILGLPLIGTLDSARTQVVMESLLTRIVETGAATAIIDITGVPTVDTLVAQHLLKTVAAARLMGADCIISGIRPQIAQTIVHLGVDLGDVTTKATLADAFAVALQRHGLGVARVAKRA